MWDIWVAWEPMFNSGLVPAPLVAPFWMCRKDSNADGATYAGASADLVTGCPNRYKRLGLLTPPHVLLLPT